MKELYNSCRKLHRLSRWIFLLIVCAIFNLISIPTSLAQLNQHKYQSNSESPVFLQSSLLSGTVFSLQSLTSQAIILLPWLNDSTNEVSTDQRNPYLMEEQTADQKITLRLPKVDVGKVMISIYSPSGNLLVKKSVRSQEESDMEMDLTNLQAGAYLMEIQAAEIYEKFRFRLE